MQCLFLPRDNLIILSLNKRYVIINFSSSIDWLLILTPLPLINLLISLLELSNLDKTIRSIIFNPLSNWLLVIETEAKASEESAKKTFSQNSLGAELPSITISKIQLDQKINITDLIILSKLETSKSEIKRLIIGNGVKINNQPVPNEKLIITKDLFKDNIIKLSLGKKRHIKVELS